MRHASDNGHTRSDNTSSRLTITAKCILRAEEQYFLHTQYALRYNAISQTLARIPCYTIASQTSDAVRFVNLTGSDTLSLLEHVHQKGFQGFVESDHDMVPVS